MVASLIPLSQFLILEEQTFSFTITVLPVMWHTGGFEGHYTVLGHCDSECGFPFAALVAVAPG